MTDLGVSRVCKNMLNNNNMSYLVSRLNAEDFELMKQITSLSKETLHFSHELRNHSQKCSDIMLNKLQQRKNEKRNQVNIEKMERDQMYVLPPHLNNKLYHNGFVIAMSEPPINSSPNTSPDTVYNIDDETDKSKSQSLQPTQSKSKSQCQSQPQSRYKYQKQVNHWYDKFECGGNENIKHFLDFIAKNNKNNRRIPTMAKDIWCHNERINYFREGSKAAIKTQVFNTKLQCLENKFIVTKIIAIDHRQQECLLIDDEDNEKKEYTQSFKNIMCLPSLSVVSLTKRNIFKAGQRCLAVYPSTTCFYKAKIIKPPKLLFKQTKYSLKFDDDGDKIKEIEAENVMPYVT